MDSTRGLPLAGLLVVSVEQAVAAPYATRQLADLGARVIKVERPGAGDFARGYDRTVHGQSSYFTWLNRGKESVVLDVKDPADRALLGAVIDRADVFVQNLIPGAAARLRLDAATLRGGRPSLIHCSVSGYGEDGPYAAKKAYDLLIQCEAGLVLSTGTPEAPAKAGFSVADLATGIYAYSGILAALYDRTRTGTGATLRVSLLDALGELMSQPAYFAHYGGEAPRRTGARHPSISPYGHAPVMYALSLIYRTVSIQPRGLFVLVRMRNRYLVGGLGRSRMAQLLDERPASDRQRPGRHRHRKQRRRPSRRAMAAMGVGAALLGAGIAVGTKTVPVPLADSYPGSAPHAATLTTAPTVSQSGASAFGYSVASVPASLAARTPASSPTPRHSATVMPTASMTRASMTPASAQAQPTAAAASSRPPAAGGGLTPQPTAEYQTPTGQNQKAWSEAILTALGDPLTSANIVAIGYWMQNEAGTPPYGIVGANNPINVSEPGYGGTQIQYEAPGYYLMSYPTVADGVAATAAYLNNGSYPQILSDLKQGAGLSDPALAGELQEYSGSGYSTIPDSWGQSQGTPES